MQTVTTIGLDIAKSVFQVHGVDAAGQVVFRRIATFWHFSRSCRLVWSALRLVHRGITGRASCRRSVTPCG